MEEAPREWQGQPYDAIQRNIRVNHLALVEKARAGDSARLNIDGEDTQAEKGGNTMSKRKDGLTPEEIAQLVEEYKKRKEQRMQGQQPDNQPAADSEGRKIPQKTRMRAKKPPLILCRRLRKTATAATQPEIVRQWMRPTG